MAPDNKKIQVCLETDAPDIAFRVQAYFMDYANRGMIVLRSKTVPPIYFWSVDTVPGYEALFYQGDDSKIIDSLDSIVCAMMPGEKPKYRFAVKTLDY